MNRILETVTLLTVSLLIPAGWAARGADSPGRACGVPGEAA
jgi:hypothetical protein